MGQYIVQADIEARISKQVVRQILDDNVDGDADKEAVDRAIWDAEGLVESYLRKVYDLGTLRTLAAASKDNVPNEIKRLSLDVCIGYLFDRFPEYVRVDGRRMRMDAMDELKDLARGLRRLDDIDTIENTKQVTVEARSGDPAVAVVNSTFNEPGAEGIF